MNIKIIEPYDLNKKYDARSFNPNLGPVAIASLLKHAGHQVEVNSEYVARLKISDLDCADLVCISITTYNAGRGYKIARKLQKPIVFGGFHASLMPEECLKYGDYVIRGDGYPIVQLAEYIDNGNIGDLSVIPNLVYKKSGNVIYNPIESGVVNRFIDHNLVRDYYKPGLKKLLRIPLLVNASRGCHYTCSFCSIKEVHPDFKPRRQEIVIKEIKALMKNQSILARLLPRVIWITDDNFFTDAAWAKSILKEIAKLKPTYSFVLQARVDNFEDDELLELLKEANVGRIYLGIESINQKSLDNYKKNTTIAEVKRAIGKIQSYGIDVYGLFVFGDDEFKIGDGIKVAEFVKRHGLVGLLVQPLTPFPGTRLFQKLKTEGRILHENWQDYNGKVVFQPRNLSPADLLKEIYQCYRIVYSPLRLAKYLWFGKKGAKLGVIGEAMFRYLEWLKIKHYIKDKLTT